MTADPWAPYEPDDTAPWDLRRVVHLHRRAGFAATWAEIRRDLKDGPEASVERLLEGRAGQRLAIGIDLARRDVGIGAGLALKRDFQRAHGVSSLRMILSDNRCPLFGIMR